MRQQLLVAIVSLSATFASSNARAGDNFIDYRLAKNTSGVFSTTLQDAVPVTLALASAGCALWSGSESRLGKSCWESGESIAISGLSAFALQYATGRRSPSETDNPNHWFTGRKGSFPSLHVTATTAAVTPIICEYFRDDPWVAALALLPAYESVARLKAREHWQTDVIAGALLGAGVGYFEYAHGNPFLLQILPGGVFVGINKKF